MVFFSVRSYRFARNGGVDARDFQRLWRQRGTSISSVTPKDCDNGAGQSEKMTLDKELRKTSSGGDARDVRPEKTFEVSGVGGELSFHNFLRAGCDVCNALAED